MTGEVVPFAPRPVPAQAGKAQEPERSALHFSEFYLNPKTFRMTMTLADREGNAAVTLEFACSRVWPPSFDMVRVIEAWTGGRGIYEPAS